MFDQIGHTQHFEDDRYQADMMVRRVTNLEVVAQGYGDAIADGAPDFATIVLFQLVIFLEWMTRRFSDLLKNYNPIFEFGQRQSGDCEPTPRAHWLRIIL